MQEQVGANATLQNTDEPCGGFNLQWAWSSGYLAGSSV